MTTITKEWLQQTIAEFENTRDDIPFGLSDDDAKVLIVLKRALASLDAEPVRYLNKFSGTCVTLEQQPNASDDVAVYIPLYAAPPAPVVPEECPAELPCAQVKAVADLFALCWQSGEVVTYTPDPEKATIWLNNYSGTCVQEYVKLERLQEALSGYSPVIPDGWISCSERMPDNDESKPIAIFTGKCLGQGMFVATYDDDGFFDYWEGMEIIGVSHWMPLPAAPEPDQS
ncbi:DUF551 domain-containing protein [Salmonella enterica subsp. enterica]|nr:DUF551 domain-containing protein [Salmonella enterica subsp. enterica]